MNDALTRKAQRAIDQKTIAERMTTIGTNNTTRRTRYRVTVLLRAASRQPIAASREEAAQRDSRLYRTMRGAETAPVFAMIEASV